MKSVSFYYGFAIIPFHYFFFSFLLGFTFISSLVGFGSFFKKLRDPFK
jgi:hypothetical protein